MKIPVGPGRRVMPSGGGMPSAPANAGVIEAQAMGNLADTAGRIGNNLLATDTQLGVEQSRKAVALAEMAARQKDQLSINTTEDALRDAHDEIANGVLQGTVPKESAAQAWDERSKKVIGDALPGFREQSRDLAGQQLQTLGLRLGNSMRKVVEKKDQQDIGAGIQQTLEYQQRQYATDPAKAEQVAMSTVDQLGPFSNFTPEQLGKMKQSWKEGTQYTTGYNAISAGRHDRKALDAADQLLANGLPDLDPQKRAALQDRAQAYRFQQDQQAELAAQRAQREADRRLKLAEHTFNTFQTLADKGTSLDPDYIDAAFRATAGTPYQQGIVALSKQSVTTGGLAAQPINVQRAAVTAVDALIAQQGRTPELDKRLTQMQKVLDGSEHDLKEDPLTAGLKRGVITQLPPLNLQAGIQGLVPQLADRVQQAGRVSTWAGRPVAPLTVQEAQGLAGMLGSMPADQRATAVQTIAATMPTQQTQALAALMDSKDRPLAIALGLGAARTTFDRPTAELVLKGAEALKNKTIKEDKEAIDGWTGSINTELQGLFNNPQQSEMVSEAARYILAGKVSEGQSAGNATIRNAVRLAVGGTIGEVNGSRVVLPAGVEQKDLDQRLKTYPPAELAPQLPDGKVYVRGQPVELQQFLAGLPAAKLVNAGDAGNYFISAGGTYVSNSNAKAIILKVPYAR